MGFIKTFIAGVGIKGGLAILTLILPAILGLIKVGKYGSALDAVMLGAGNTVSIFLRTKAGKSIEKIAEWLIIKILIMIVIFPILSFIYGMRRDNKVTLGVIILDIKDRFNKLLLLKK